MDDEEAYDKALGQYRLTLNGLLQPLRRFGQGKYVDGVIEELVQLAIRLHWRLSGDDIPFEVRDLHW